MTDESLTVGVVGVGSMGQHHARVYRELPEAQLVGVADADPTRATEIAETYNTRAVRPEELLAMVDAVSIATPTATHYQLARRAIESGVHVLVEKPFVEEVNQGRELIDLAGDRGVVLQVGHIERFNPAIRALSTLVSEFDIIAMDARRLGPPVAREIDVNPVFDLMIHDLDIIRTLIDEPISTISATEVIGEPYVSATLAFENGVVGTLLASRITQQKVRTLSVTADDSYLAVDYIDQTVEIHRQSLPEYLERAEGVRFRQQHVVERPTTVAGEPLKLELESFVQAARTNSQPEVSGEDGLEAVALAQRIMDRAMSKTAVPAPPVTDPNPT